MVADEEPAKQLLPYLQRADELQKHDALVAYYCRLYAMERGLKIPQSDCTKTTNALLISLMNQLEKDKKSVKLGPDDHLHLEGFALNVFAKADKQDRAGRADLNTAKTFYAASVFFEILNQFGPLPPDLEQKQKYAAWKAADIRKALKEGRQPLAGPPGGDNDLQVLSSTSSGEYDLGTSRYVSASNKNQPGPLLRSDSPRQVYDQNDFHNPTSILPQPSNVLPTPSSSSDIPHPASSTDGYSPNNLHQPPSMNCTDRSIYHQPYHPQPYQPEPQQHLPHQYPSHDMSPYSYPNFQSYPSLSDSSLPAVPTHYPSQYQGSEVSYTTSSPSNAAPFPSMSQYNSSSRILEVSPPTVEKYEYNSSYQPPPEKVAEAHKAARFAVGALAFDDVATAVDYLKKSLELLTNPSAGH